jgi:putative transposase
VDTQGLVLEALRVHGAQIQDREGPRRYQALAAYRHARPSLPKRLSHLWLDAGYTGEEKGAGWVHKVSGWTAEIVRHPPKLAPEEVMRAWAREWNKEVVPMDVEKFMPQKGPRPFLPKRWIVERTFSWLVQNRRMSKDYERLPESSEAFIYVAMSRLMARRLARWWGFSDSFEAVEKLPITACGPQFGLKNACFGPLKPDFESPEPVYVAMNVPESSFSTASYPFSAVRE